MPNGSCGNIFCGIDTYTNEPIVCKTSDDIEMAENEIDVIEKLEKVNKLEMFPTIKDKGRLNH